MRLVFFDCDEELVETYRLALPARVGATEIEFEAGDVSDVIDRIRPDAIVSPANSQGFMNGGIDGVYRELFPGVEQRVRAAIAASPLRVNGGLPIGQTLVVETGHAVVPYLIVAPTMVWPSKVRDHRVIAEAMKAIWLRGRIIEEVLRRPVTVLCPGLGTGVGMMSASDSARQIRAALSEVA